MREVTYNTKVGATERPYDTQLLNADGTAADLTNVQTVQLQKAPAYPGSAWETLTAAVLGTPTDGWVRRQWEAADIASPGFYWLRWKVTYQGGGVEVFPAYGNMVMYVES